MNFRQRNQPGIPQIDLIPMLNVMMGILAFFVMISITLGNEQWVEMELPPQGDGADTVSAEDASVLVVQLDERGEWQVQGQPVTSAQLAPLVMEHLAANPDHRVFLAPNRQIPYETVIGRLTELRQMGGDRIALALEDRPPEDRPEPTP